MRWFPKQLTEVGSLRTVRRFLFLPKTLPSSLYKQQTRWLEFVKINQKYESVTVTSEFSLGEELKWVDLMWHRD